MHDFTSDVFCAKSDKVIENLPGVQKIVDDILICANNKKELETKMVTILNNCREHNITISKEKLAIGTEIEFAGYKISPKGIEPDESKLKALLDFPPPKNISELRSFLGLANQLGGFVQNLAATTDPLRQLLKKNRIYNWTPDLQQAFDNTIKILTSPAVVNFYDPQLPTTSVSYTHLTLPTILLV